MHDKDIQLLEISVGKTAVIKQINGERGLQRRLTSLGVRVGKTVCKVGSVPLKGPIVVEVDRIKVAIGRRIAIKILIEELHT